MDVREFQGKAVVSLDDAERVGRVSDVLFETDRLRIAGFRVEGEEGDYVLPFDRISSVGPDAITVETQDMVRRQVANAPVDNLPGLSELIDLKIVDESGTYQGTVRTFDADGTTGEVSSLDIEKGGVMGLGSEHQSIPVSTIRSIGRGVITVRNAVG